MDKYDVQFEGKIHKVLYGISYRSDSSHMIGIHRMVPGNSTTYPCRRIPSSISHKRNVRVRCVHKEGMGQDGTLVGMDVRILALSHKYRRN